MTATLFVVFPYIALTLSVGVTLLRWRRQPFTVSSLSTQLLERRRLYWGSVSFHWGIVLILLAHLAALVVPRGLELWNRVPVRLYLLELTGFALGLWALGGVVVLLVRRLGTSRIKAVTTPMDLVVLLVLLAQVVTGLWIAAGYRWGSFWGTAVFVPYVRSLLALRPRPELVADLPGVLQAHVLLFFAFAAVFPFSRLVHMLALPLRYLTRPWQIVIRDRPTPNRVRSNDELGHQGEMVGARHGHD